MKNQTCEFEKAVIKQSIQGVTDEKLAFHIKECANCQEALKVASFMQNFAAASAPKRSLPTAGFIVWKSKIIEKQQAGKLAARPILWTQKAALILAVITTIWLAIQFQPQLEIVIKNFSTSFELIAVPFLITFVCAAFVCIVIAFKWRKSLGKN